jgi:hypothetical protein
MAVTFWGRSQPVEDFMFQETIVALFPVGSWNHARSGTSAPFGQEVPGGTPVERCQSAVPAEQSAIDAVGTRQFVPLHFSNVQTVNRAGPRGNPSPFPRSERGVSLAPWANVSEQAWH